MRPHGRDLRTGLVDEDVTALHADLDRLGYVIPVTERTQRLFGVATARAVAAFQGEHGLIVSPRWIHATYRGSRV